MKELFHLREFYHDGLSVDWSESYRLAFSAKAVAHRRRHLLENPPLRRAERPSSSVVTPRRGHCIDLNDSTKMDQISWTYPLPLAIL